LVLLIGGIAAGIGLFVVSGSQYEQAVKDFQRAPVGCDTEFTFTGTGTFIFYTETTGAVGDLRGDCDNANRDYERDADDRPRVTLTLVDDDGDEIDLDRNTDASYDKGGFVGTAVREITIDEPAEYTLSVESEDDNFAIAVGRDPKSDADQLKVVAIIVAATGIVLGGLFIVLGLRRRQPVAAVATTGVPTAFETTGYPSGPPAPSYPESPYPASAAPPIAPPFGQPTSAPPASAPPGGAAPGGPPPAPPTDPFRPPAPPAPPQSSSAPPPPPPAG